MSSALHYNLATLAEAIRNKQLSPVEITKDLLARIALLNPKLNAFITILAEDALADAAQAEQEIMAGNLKGPLHGVPIGLKDLIYTKGIRTTMGSEMFKDFAPDYDAAVVERLRASGSILIGKLNTHQFAYGPTGDRSYFGPSRNPYDTSRITGGSSSGSGVAVATAMCYGALGTDTGGSIRIPAACCGIVGMKPTFGRISKFGVFPLGYTLDHVGPMTRTVLDNALMLNVLAGFDSRDPYSIRQETEDFTRYVGQGIKGSRIGVPSNYYFDNVEEEVAEKVWSALEIFRSLGAEIRNVEIPDMKEIVNAQHVTLKSEAYAVHEEKLRDPAAKWDQEVKERLCTGAETKAYEYVQAQQVKHTAIQAFEGVLKEVDILAAPTLPILPVEIEQRKVTVGGVSEHVRTALTRLTGPTNFNGFPSLSVPCGFSQSGLPIGLQLIGCPHTEATLYRFGYAFEQAACIPTVKYNIPI